MKLTLADKIGETWQRGDQVPESTYKFHSIGNYTVEAIEKGNAEIVEKVNGRELQERINTKVKNLSELVNSPEKKALLLKAEQENIFNKPESLNGKNIVEIIRTRIDDLNSASLKLRGVEDASFKIKRGDVSKAVSSMDFKQQVVQAQKLVQKTKGMER